MIKAVLIYENVIIKDLSFTTDNEMYCYKEGFHDGTGFWNGSYRIVKVEEFPKNPLKEHEIVNSCFD